MLDTQQTLFTFTFASFISLLGVWSQQPSIIGAGAGLAGGIGSARLAQSRQKDSKTLDMLQEMDDTRFKAMGKTLDTIIEAENAQSDRIEQLSNDSIEIEQVVEQLNKQFQVQKTALNLQTKSIQKLQQDNHANRGIIAAKEKEISDYQSQLNSLVTKLEQNKVIVPKTPTTHLFVDGNGVRFVEKKLSIQIDYQALRAALTQGTDNVMSRFYISDAGSSKHKRRVKNLHEIGFEVSLFPIVKVGNKVITKGDDLAIAIDTLKYVVPGDTVVFILGGDGDFVPLLKHLTLMGVNLKVVSYLPTTSWLLKRQVGKNLIDLRSLICANEDRLSEEPALV